MVFFKGSNSEFFVALSTALRNSRQQRGKKNLGGGESRERGKTDLIKNSPNETKNIKSPIYLELTWPYLEPWSKASR